MVKENSPESVDVVPISVPTTTILALANGSPASDVTFPVTDCANNIIGVSRVIIIAIRLRLFISNLLVSV